MYASPAELTSFTSKLPISNSVEFTIDITLFIVKLLSNDDHRGYFGGTIDTSYRRFLGQSQVHETIVDAFDAADRRPHQTLWDIFVC